MTEEVEQQTAPDEPSTERTSRRWPLLVVVMSTIVVTVGMYIWWLTTPPNSFMQSTSLEIEPGMSARSIAEAAEAAGVVRSASVLYFVLATQYDPTNIFAGRYVFPAPSSVFTVAERLASQDTEEELIRITFPEGITAHEMATIASNAVPAIDADEYINLTRNAEGTLFPETYYVPAAYTAAALVRLQQDTYTDQLSERRPAIEASNFSQEEIIILASIVEREANDNQSMKMVAGILQNRLAIGMALQADAAIEYILDTPLNELPPGQLAAELRETESPYNTYKNPGLPPTPIGNPGLQAIDAVLEPTTSDYLYYITGNDGVFYYAETLEQHNLNIARHLR